MYKEDNEEEIDEEIKEDGEEDVYDEEKAEELEEAEEINESEEGFMKGYNEEIDPTKCANCSKPLTGKGIIEEEIDEETYYFCSEKCANKFSSKLK